MVTFSKKYLQKMITENEVYDKLFNISLSEVNHISLFIYFVSKVVHIQLKQNICITVYKINITYKMLI